MEIVIASGKGGTGKTFLASNISIFFDRRLGGAVAADADVEAPDLVLALGGEKTIISRREVWESAKAHIDDGLCTGCMKCLEVCSFDAITVEDSRPKIIEEFCEGCGACAIICPSKAINVEEALTGHLLTVESASGIHVVMGDLEVGGRNTGHIVYAVREDAKKLAGRLGKRFVIVDAAPGIGCPVVSSLSGADVLLIVVEPTPQSLQGARRVLEVARAFRLRSYLVLNKYDLSEEFSKRVCEKLGLDVLGWIPYDEEIVESYTMMKPIALAGSRSRVRSALKEVFEALVEKIMG